jgi:hypothetical protein
VNNEIENTISKLPSIEHNYKCLKYEKCIERWIYKLNILMATLNTQESSLQYNFNTNITNENEEKIVEFSVIFNDFMQFIKPSINKLTK